MISDGKLRFSLFGHETPWLLIEYPTGVKYSGQVGGMMCDHPEVEGVAIPLQEKIWNVLRGVSCPGGCCGSLDDECVERIKKLWPQTDQVDYGAWGIRIEFDESRSQSHGTECWFPVKILKDEEKLKQQNYSDALKARAEILDGRNGFVMMPDNCD